MPAARPRPALRRARPLLLLLAVSAACGSNPTPYNPTPGEGRATPSPTPPEAEALRCRDALEARGVRWFPQLFKTGGGVADYPDEAALRAVIGDAPGPREANLAPSYQGRTCHAGVEYFTVDKDGEAWACRTAKRHGEGRLGNVFDGHLAFFAAAAPCPYTICPCTVPANRGMIAGIGPAA